MGAIAAMQIDSGRVSGVATADGAVTAFKGIPYAAPPVGALRWRPPQAVAPWSGVRACDAFGPRAIQMDRPQNSISYFGQEPESEDCLFLNIWTAARERDERRPVMVYFHGGAYAVGSGAIPLFDGTELARRGVVLVTVNYRLGRLGFLAHSALSAESSAHASGNYGLMDQIAAVRWVGRNIATFGGDPDCITIFGQSAGSISGSCLMASPLARGTFHRAIGMSGALLGPVCETSVTGDSIQALDDAEASGDAFARKLNARTADDLRALPARDLQLTSYGPADPAQFDRGVFETHWPIVDGEVLPEAPYAVFAQGKQNDVPLISGNVSNEGATMPFAPNLAAFEAQARADFGDDAGRYLALFPAKRDADVTATGKRAFSYRNFVWQNWAWATLHKRTGHSPVYAYRFTHAPPVPVDAIYAECPGSDLRAYHCAELHYVFGTFGVRDWVWTDEDRRLGDTMSAYWITFAKTGNPNGGGLPAWPEFDAAQQRMMMLGPSPVAKPPPDLAELAFWDDHYARGREREGQRRKGAA